MTFRQQLIQAVVDDLKVANINAEIGSSGEYAEIRFSKQPSEKLDGQRVDGYMQIKLEGMNLLVLAGIFHNASKHKEAGEAVRNYLGTRWCLRYVESNADYVFGDSWGEISAPLHFKD